MPTTIVGWQYTDRGVLHTMQKIANFASGNQRKLYCFNHATKTSKYSIMAQIIVNDEKQDVTLPLTLSELIKLNKVFQPEMVTVQVNEEFVEKEDYDKTQIKEGDHVDFLYFMGGGSL